MFSSEFDYIAEEEFEKFISDMPIEEHEVYIDEDEYSDEFSGNDIGQIQDEFLSMVKRYLKEKYSGEYCVYTDWCVHIAKKEWYLKVIAPKKPVKAIE